MVESNMLPYFQELQHPTEQGLINRIAYALHKIEKELDGSTHWSFTRKQIKERDEWGNLHTRARTAEELSDPLANLDYQASILETISTELQKVEDDIGELEDEGTRSALTIWHSTIYRRFFDLWQEYSKIAGAVAD